MIKAEAKALPKHVMLLERNEMNIRQITGMSPNYYEINREERNYAAIFFAALSKPENAEKFLKHCGFESSIGPEFGIYFEYAYLRDMHCNSVKH